jgi:hypothetical protein
MARTRKSAYERLVEKQKEAEQAENAAKILKSQIRDEERRKDTRRKVLGGAVAFAHARLDPVWRESFAIVMDKAGAAMKTERAQSEVAELVKYVRAGCPDVDIDQRIDEMQRTANAPTPAKVSPPPQQQGKPRNPSPPS